MLTLSQTYDRARTFHDVRREPVGGFAGVLGPDAPVGSFADVPHRRRQGCGAFAGDGDRQRQGSYADGERGPRSG